ncbi:MAG: hypothetical protein IKU14_00510 [Rhodocyclaceae bacterium]|nr:hypothetical protein [Rhodocyclaceae bacterium]
MEWEELKRSIDVSRARRREEDARQATEGGALAPSPSHQPRREPVQLPLWPEPVRAVPNGFLRSALFGAIRKGRRHYLDGEQLAALDGIEIRYTGERLDQGDLDVWESVLHAVRLQSLGSQCRVTSYTLLKLMGKTDTGKNRATLHKRITRLRANAVEVRQGRYCYIGGLIASAAKDEQTQEWVIELDAKLQPLFAYDQFTQVQWAERLALEGQPLAQWLHGFYASHAAPVPIKVDTLRSLSGSEAAAVWKFAQTLRKALDAVSKVRASNGNAFEWRIEDGLVHITKTPSRSQRRHLRRMKRAG